MGLFSLGSYHLHYQIKFIVCPVVVTVVVAASATGITAISNNPIRIRGFNCMIINNKNEKVILKLFYFLDIFFKNVKLSLFLF